MIKREEIKGKLSFWYKPDAPLRPARIQPLASLGKIPTNEKSDK